jgi:predicted nucleic acid-binding protein
VKKSEEEVKERANLEKMFRGIPKQARPAARDWADSYLWAFAEAADLSAVTFDRAIKQKNGSVLLLQ